LIWEEALAAVQVDLRLVLSIKNQSSKIKNHTSNGRVKNRVRWEGGRLVGGSALGGNDF
jgi:hypothetical protein